MRTLRVLLRSGFARSACVGACALAIVGCPKSSPAPAPSASSSTSGSAASASASVSASTASSDTAPHDYRGFTDDELAHAIDLHRSIAMVQVKSVTASTDVGTKAQGARYDFQLLQKLYGSPTSIALERADSPPRLIADRIYVVLVDRTFKELVDAREVEADKFKDVGHDYQTRIDKLAAAAEAADSASASASASASTPPSASASVAPPASASAKK